MFIASRKICAALLFSLFALGCGSKGTPEKPNVQLDPKDDPKPVAAKPTYEMDPAKHVIPAEPVAGKLVGVDVTAEVRLEGKNLIFQKPMNAAGDEWRLSIELPAEPAHDAAPSRVVLAPEAELPGMTAWTIFVTLPKPMTVASWKFFSFTGWQPLNHLAWRGGCAITLELGKRENGKLPGKVYLSLPEMPDAHPDTPKGSFLAGTFVAECARQAADPPSMDDVPFVRGAIHLKVPAPNTNLRAGYVGSLGPDQFCLCEASVDLDGGQSARSNYDKPRVATLHAGDGKMTPSRYEHSKLAPGRYLVFAQLKDGPMAWKWVDVKAGDMATADLTIDATQTGGLEVTPPLEELSKVQLAPLDEPGKLMMTDSLFQAISLLLRTEANVVARKAVFKNLPPGRYEVRTRQQSRTVEVVAGKTVELDFDKKP